MKTITFYSFKGGVGRSLMLSNMALWLADEMKAKVCVIDFDLEAPGLPYKFEDLQNPADQERLAKTEGIVEYVDEFNQTGYPPADFTRFYLPFITSKGNPVTLIPAGNLQEADYWRKLFAINWQQLFEHDPATGYSKGLLLLEDLKGRIEAELAPDFLLIDSRTGLTETASITLKLMADKAILVGINNRENQDGLFWVLRSLQADPSSRDLPYHLVLNRVPMQHGTGRKEIDPREKAISTQFLHRFERLAPIKDLIQCFSIIHADDEQAFGEKLQEGFYVEAQPKVQIRKDYWDVFTQITKEYLTEEQWALFERKRKAYELYYQAEFDVTDIQEQITLLTRAIEICDDDAFLYNYRFKLYYKAERDEDALLDINKAIELNTERVGSVVNLGIIYNKQQKYSLAIETYKKAIEIESDNHQAWYNLGITYRNQKQYDLSIKAYQRAVEIKPDYYQAWYNLGSTFVHVSYNQQGEQKSKTLQKALQATEQAIQSGAGKFYNLSRIYALLSDKKKALASLKQALERKQQTVEYVLQDRDFASWREDEDFKALLAKFSN